MVETVKAARPSRTGRHAARPGRSGSLSTPAPVLPVCRRRRSTQRQQPEQLPPVINLPPTELTVNRAGLQVNSASAIPQAYEVQVTSRDAQA